MKITFKTAKLAKRAGFNPPEKRCEAHELQTWLRDEKGIHVNPRPYFEPYGEDITGYYIGEIFLTGGRIIHEGDDNYPSFEEALDGGLRRSLKLLVE